VDVSKAPNERKLELKVSAKFCKIPELWKHYSLLLH